MIIQCESDSDWTTKAHVHCNLSFAHSKKRKYEDKGELTTIKVTKNVVKTQGQIRLSNNKNEAPIN
jgi:hypothetical protein